MDVEDSAELSDFRARARTWIARNAPRHLERELKRGVFGDNGVISVDPIEAGKAWQKAKAAAGWACVDWPKEFGGAGGGPMEQWVWAQEEGIYAGLSEPFVVGIGMCGPTLMRWASDALKRRHLPRIASAEEVWCQLFSEPGCGSDLAAVRTRAERVDGDAWLINGQKIWTSYAQHAAFGLLLTRTDSSLPKHRGLTMFLINMDSPGVEVRPIRQANGKYDFNEVFFTNAVIPDAKRLGDVNSGWQVAMTTLMNERQSIGQGMPTGWDELFAYFCNQHQSGDGDIAGDLFTHQLAELAIKANGLKYLALRAATSVVKRETPGPEHSVSKLVAAATMQELATLALEIQGCCGGIGHVEGELEGLFQSMFVRSAATRIEGGTEEILQNIIAERVLGMPGDLRADKGVAFRDLPLAPSN